MKGCVLIAGNIALKKFSLTGNLFDQLNILVHKAVAIRVESSAKLLECTEQYYT